MPLPPPSRPPPPSFHSFQTNFQAPPLLLPSTPLLSLSRQIPRARPAATQNQRTMHFGEMTMTKTKSEKEEILEDIDTAIMRYISPLK